MPDDVEVAIKSDLPTHQSAKVGYTESDTFMLISENPNIELDNLKNFTIDHEFGRVQWLEPVDVRGLDLNKIVQFESKIVNVYGDTKGEIPPRGVGLNKPARITIKNVVPKKGTDAARIEKRRKKLMEINAKERQKFVSYENFEWTFEVDGF